MLSTDCPIPARNRTTSKFLLFAGVMLIASVLRAPITNVGPLLDTIRADLDLSTSMGGVLASLPVFIFAAFSPLAGFAGRFGIERSLMLALFLIALGILVRSLGFSSTLFAGTALLSFGIAIGNVLLPTVIKRDFPQKAAALTIIYITWMTSLGAISSGIAVPAAAWAALCFSDGGLSWRASLAVWLIVAVAAAFVWFPQIRCPHKALEKKTGKQATSILKSPIAWQITIFMGLQSMGFYVIITWLAAILQDNGYNAEKSGWLVAFYQIISLASGLFLPFVIARTKDQSVITAVCGLLCCIGTLGLFLAPQFAVLWLTLAGFGGGGSFILAIAFISLRTRTHQQATSLSAMVNGGGYLIASFGPLFFGMLHDIVHTWQFLLIGLTLAGAAQAVAGWLAGRGKTV